MKSSYKSFKQTIIFHSVKISQKRVYILNIYDKYFRFLTQNIKTCFSLKSHQQFAGCPFSVSTLWQHFAKHALMKQLSKSSRGLATVIHLQIQLFTVYSIQNLEKHSKESY